MYPGARENAELACPSAPRRAIMPEGIPDAWNIGEREGLVDIGTHKLWLRANGPPRHGNSPAVIIIQGLASSSTGWAAVQRLLSTSNRVYSYERSGYGKSEQSPNLPNSTTIAHELNLLLTLTNTHPPYVLVAHSWGGILSREFISLRQKDVVGVVFVEANQEHTLQILDWRQADLATIQIGVDGINATGLLYTHRLMAEEWQLYRATESAPKFQKQASLEFIEYANSFPLLESKHQLQRHPPLLGERPVCVIKGDNEADMQKMFDAGVALGNGNAMERAAYQETLRTWDKKDRGLQRESLSLSVKNRYVETAKGAGHNVQLTYPEVIVDEVRWVLAHVDADL